MRLTSITARPLPTETSTSTARPNSASSSSTLPRTLPEAPSDFVDRPGSGGWKKPPPPPPPPPGKDPWTGKSNTELLSALRSYTTTGKTSVSYDRARDIIFGQLDVKNGKVKCVYTNREIPGGHTPSSSDMNVEHTWPQSRGATGTAKSDLHHLFPTDSKANSIRGNYEFGIVTKATWTSPSGAKFGTDASGRRCFEPPPEHKGNVARALMYFATTYNKHISPAEEAVLRQWNVADPVDADEVARNTKIEAIQHNRNPFVDYPQLADRVQDF